MRNGERQDGRCKFVAGAALLSAGRASDSAGNPEVILVEHSSRTVDERTQITRLALRLSKWFVWAGIGVALALAGCLSDGNGGPPQTVYAPVVVLERGGGSTKITIYPNSAEFVADGVVRYTGSATAEISGDPSAGRSPVSIEGTAEATVDSNRGERSFSFTSNGSSDLGWSGLRTDQVSILLLWPDPWPSLPWARL